MFAVVILIQQSRKKNRVHGWRMIEISALIHEMILIWGHGECMRFDSGNKLPTANKVDDVRILK